MSKPKPKLPTDGALLETMEWHTSCPNCSAIIHCIVTPSFFVLRRGESTRTMDVVCPRCSWDHKVLVPIPTLQFVMSNPLMRLRRESEGCCDAN